MTLRERPGDQVLPQPGQQDVSTSLVAFLRSYGAVNGTEVRAGAIGEDLEKRIELGVQRYGQRLQTFNGRDALRDLYEELLDAAHYAEQLESEALATKGPHLARAHLLKYSIVGILFDVQTLLSDREEVIP